MLHNLSIRSFHPCRLQEKNIKWYYSWLYYHTKCIWSKYWYWKATRKHHWWCIGWRWRASTEDKRGRPDKGSVSCPLLWMNVVRANPLWYANFYRPISPSRLVVHHTRGKWLWGGISLQQGKDCVIRKKSELCIISNSHRLTWTSGRVAVLHPLPPGATVTATKTIGKFCLALIFPDACTLGSVERHPKFDQRRTFLSRSVFGPARDVDYARELKNQQVVRTCRHTVHCVAMINSLGSAGRIN